MNLSCCPTWRRLASRPKHMASRLTTLIAPYPNKLLLTSCLYTKPNWTV